MRFHLYPQKRSLCEGVSGVCSRAEKANAMHDIRAIGWIAIFCTGLTGCVTEELDTAPGPVGLAPEKSASGFSNTSSRVVKPDSTPWWKKFGDTSLNRTVSVALQRNPDVRSIERRIDQAAALVVQAGSTLYPQIDGFASYEGARGQDGDRSADSALGLLLDWELDVWGRIRSGRAARANELDAAVDDWRAAKLFLSTGVVETWYGLAEQRLQRQLVTEQIELNEILLRLTRLRFGQGQGSSVDVLQQQQQVEATRVLLPDIDARIEEFSLALEFLIGHTPGKTSRFPEANDLVSLPPHPDAGLPSELLSSRPDLRAQQARVRAVDHEVGEALADLLPRFSIGGSAALVGSPTPETLIANAVAGAIGPIVDGGNRRAEVARQRARLAEELDIFTNFYLDAVRETETALSQEREVQRRIGLQETQLKTARKLLSESRNRYSEGLTDYLPVLDAISRVQQLERDLITSRRERISARIALHRALGGPMPSP